MARQTSASAYVPSPFSPHLDINNAACTRTTPPTNRQKLKPSKGKKETITEHKPCKADLSLAYGCPVLTVAATAVATIHKSFGRKACGVNSHVGLEAWISGSRLGVRAVGIEGRELEARVGAHGPSEAAVLHGDRVVFRICRVDVHLHISIHLHTKRATNNLDHPRQTFFN